MSAGYPTADVSSMAWYKAHAHYHWPRDRPENPDFGSIADAGDLAVRLVRHLDADRPGS